MKRKVVKQGPATLMVSLPAKWVKENSIEQGDELNTFTQGNKIIFSQSEESAKRKEITLNLDNYNTYISLSRYLTVFYKTGFNKIILNYSKSSDKILLSRRRQKLNLKSAIRVIVDRFVGAEIVSQSSTKTEIECFATEETPDLDKIESRIYFLFNETLKELVDSIGPKFNNFNDSVYEHHDNITKFINYFFRQLYNSKKSEDEKKFSFSFYSRIEHLVDKTRHLSEEIAVQGCTPKVKKYLQAIFDMFNEQYSCFFKNTNVTEDIIERRYELKTKIREDQFSAKEYRVLAEALVFLDILNVFSEYIISKNLDNYLEEKND